MKKSVFASVILSCVCGAFCLSASASAEPSEAEIQQAVIENQKAEAMHAVELEQIAKDTKVATLARLSGKDAGILLDNAVDMSKYKCSDFIADIEVYEKDLALYSANMSKFMWIYGYTLGKRGVESATENDPTEVMIKMVDSCDEHPDALILENINKRLSVQP